MSRFMRSLRLALLPGLFALGIAGTAAAADGWLGVVTQSISEDLRDALNLRGDGVVVNQVVSGSPADRAGIRRGDVITSVNGRSVDSPEDLAEIVRSEDSGSNVSVRIVRRGGGSQTLNVRLGSRPDSDRGDRDGDEDWKDSSPTPAPTPGHTETHVWKDGKEVDPKDIEDELPGFRGFGNMNGFPGMGRPRLGVRLQKMNSDLAAYFGGTNGRGALVVEVVEDSPADRAGIKAGDVVIAVEGTNVDDPDDLVRAIADEEGRTSLTIVRRGSRRTIDADLGDRSRSDTWRMRDGRAPRAPRAPVAPGIGRNDGDEDSRREIQELRDEIRELKRQLEEKDKDDR